MSVFAVAALPGHEIVLLDWFGIAALVTTGLAWLLIVAALGLELTGRLPVGQRRPRRTGLLRIQLFALLALATMGLINEIANALPWPYPVRSGLALAAMAVSVIAIVIFIRTARASRTVAR
jgi:hypothetical protein